MKKNILLGAFCVAISYSLVNQAGSGESRIIENTNEPFITITALAMTQKHFDKMQEDLQGQNPDQKNDFEELVEIAHELDAFGNPLVAGPYPYCPIL